LKDAVERTARDIDRSDYGWYKTLPMPKVTARQILMEMRAKYSEADWQRCEDGSVRDKVSDC